MAFKVLQVDHIGIGVSDLAATKEFYKNALGMEHLPEDEVDEEQKVAQEFGVMSIPTLLVKKDGQPVEKLIGYHDQAKLEAILAQYL